MIGKDNGGSPRTHYGDTGSQRSSGRRSLPVPGTATSQRTCPAPIRHICRALFHVQGPVAPCGPAGVKSPATAAHMAASGGSSPVQSLI